MIRRIFAMREQAGRQVGGDGGRDLLQGGGEFPTDDGIGVIDERQGQPALDGGTHGPGPQRRLAVARGEGHEIGDVGGGRKRDPESAEATFDRSGSIGDHGREVSAGRLGQGTAFSQDLAGLPGQQTVGIVHRHLRQGRRLQLRQVLRARLRVAVGDAVDSSIAPIPDFLVVVMAGLRVGPVADVQGAVRADALGDGDEPGVVAAREIARVMADIPAALGLDLVGEHAVAMQVAEQQQALVGRGEVVAVVDRQAAMGMTAPGLVRAVGLDDAALGGTMHDGPREVRVVGDGLDVVVGVGLEMLAGLTLVTGAGQDVIKVRDHAGRDEHLSAGVEVQAPRVARALGEDLEGAGPRVEAPDAGVDLAALLGRRTRLADDGVGEYTVAAVEPAIGAPGEAVQGLMGVLHRPTIEHHLGLARAILRVLGDEEQFGRRADPDAAVADLDAAHEVEAFEEDRALGVRAVAVHVLEDEDAVAPLALAALAGVGHTLDDPETAAFVEAHRDRLHHARLGGHQRDLEAGGQGHRLHRLGGCLPVLVVLQRDAPGGTGREVGGEGGYGEEGRSEQDGAHRVRGLDPRYVPLVPYHK